VHLRAGNLAATRRLLAKYDDNEAKARQVRFDLALVARDFPAAAAQVVVSDMDNLGDNLQRFATLAQRAPGTLLTAPMMLVVLAGLLVLGALALLPGLLLVPVHYRGLVRRMRGKPAVAPFEAIGLRHAWLGLALVLVVPSVVGLLVEPAAMLALFGDEAVPAAAPLFRSMLWGTIAGLACLPLLMRGMDRRQLVGDRAALRASWRVLLAWGFLVGLAIALAKFNQVTGNNASNAHVETMQALAQGGVETGGPLMSLLLMALLVPIFEELTFRGLLLGGLARHISFGWANTLQAALFAVIHDDPPRIPFYFALGLLCGWLVKKTRSLGPAIALHVLNNALAVSVKVF
jgi:membrane protease YdiL (CAAX protease family)